MTHDSLTWSSDEHGGHEVVEGAYTVVVAWIALIFASALSTLKLIGFLIGIGWVIAKGGSMARRMRENAEVVGEEAEREKASIIKAFHRSRPIETYLLSPIRPRLLGGALQALFHGISVLVVDVSFSLGFMQVGGVPNQLRLVIATLTVVLLLLQLLTTLLRSLIFGAHDARLPDMQIPGFAAVREWAVYRTPGVNVAVYVLMVTGMIALVFAQLYYALYSASHEAFHAPNGAGPLTWIYFSAVTIATVGYGDMYPVGWATQLATTAEIACGPLVLTWLISSYLTRAD